MGRQLLHIGFSCWLVLITSGFTLKQHYCLGEYQYTTLSLLEIDCCEQEETPPLWCCNDVFQHFELENDFQPSPEMGTAPISLDTSFPLAINTVSSYSFQHPAFSQYLPIPPPIRQDHHAWFQLFLI